MPPITEALNKKYGPLTGKAWAAIAGAGALGWYFLRPKGEAGGEDFAGEAEEGTSSGNLYAPAGYGESALAGGLYVAPAPSYAGAGAPPGYSEPGYAIAPEYTAPLEPPPLTECPEGYLLDIFGRCVPDPSLVPIPETGGGGGGGKLTPQQRARIGNLREAIQGLRAGGVTKQERRKIKAKREKIQRIRGR